jgi:chemotaxis response regulator CheB
MGVRVLVVSDDGAVRASLCEAVRQAPGLALVGAAVTAPEAASATLRLGPDVVLIDDHLDHGGWIRVCRRVRSLDPRVAVLVSGSRWTSPSPRSRWPRW